MSKKIGCGGFRIDDDTLKLKDDGTLYAIGGGVQPDWNQNDSTATDYIKNRPFYSIEQVEAVNWDGDKTDKVQVNNLFYKVSDLTPTASEYVYYFKSGETETRETISGNNTYTGFCLIGEKNVVGVVVCYDTSQKLMGSISFPETGIYFGVSGSTYVSKLEWVTETIKTIDHKYIEHKFIVDATNLPTSNVGWSDLHTALNNAYNSGDDILLDVYGDGDSLLKLTNCSNNNYLFLYAKSNNSIKAYILYTYVSDGGGLKEISITTTTETQ